MMEASSPETVAPGPRRAGGTVIPHRLPWPKRLLVSVGYGLIRLVSASLRFSFEDRTGGLFNAAAPEPVIFAIWHNRLALSLIIYLKHPCKLQPGRRMAAMVSASRDGALVAHLLRLFGVEPVRGSSSRRGPQALLELTTWAERGFDLALTPDGPRGPCYVVQDGVIALAQLTGLPIVPVSYHLSWKIRAKSWDRFQVPLPFGPVEVIFDEPVRLPRDLSEADREEWRRRLEERLRAITRD